eukprot:1909386-Prymnesium_polylepis.1
MPNLSSCFSLDLSFFLVACACVRYKGRVHTNVVRRPPAPPGTVPVAPRDPQRRRTNELPRAHSAVARRNACLAIGECHVIPSFSTALARY